MAIDFYPPECNATRLGELLQPRNALHGVSGNRQLRLRTSTLLPQAQAQGPIARHAPLLRQSRVRGIGCPTATVAAHWPTTVYFEVKTVGEPDAGNPHVRFDERESETERTS